MAATNRGKPPAAPRTVNVQKFAESRGLELESLQSLVANRLNNDFRSQRNGRKRTTGHDDRLAKKNDRKRKRQAGSRGSSGQVEEQKRVSRRVRRRMELRDNPVDGFSTSGDGSKRLRTHVWHAKRFTMTQLWGFNLPLGLQGRGRGSRALLKWYKRGTLVHDASYYTCVELKGSEASLLSVLKMVLVPPSETMPKDDCPVLAGAICGNAMLHHVELPSPQAIAPVTYMWRPIQPQEIRSNEHCDREGCDDSNCPKDHSSHRQLWIWLHASVVDEGFEALKVACSKLINETGNVITMSSLGGKLTKFQVMGSKVGQLLRRVLEVVGSDNGRQLHTCSVLKPHSCPHQMKPLELETEDKSVSHSIISLTVRDPRDISVCTNVLASEGDSLEPSLRKKPGVEDEGQIADPEILDNCGSFEFSSLNIARDTFTNKTLWDTKNGVDPPVDEHSLSAEKHSLQLASYSIADLSSKASVDLAKLKQPRSCSIMLIKDATNGGLHTGWTIILPVSWAKTFWIPLILNGAHAIGLREKHWIASEVGLPFFPWDFPDCNAYASYKAAEAAKLNLEADRRPLAVSPIRVPIQTPWNCVQLALDADFSKPVPSNSTKNIPEAIVVHDDLSGKLDKAASDSIQQNHDATRFPGTVARTSSELVSFADQNIGQNFPLFPFSMNKNRLSDWELSENIDQAQNGFAPQEKNRNLFFVRVTLHAFKEGVFEEGAVVCAPSPADVQSWKSSFCSVIVHKTEMCSFHSIAWMLPSGHWALQIPEDPDLLRTHRWPVGFVTTGFVRGSKKVAACAFCDASLLGLMRREQWRNIPAKNRKRDIYVLVRNLRSNTYRLAIANVVLEHQESDAGLM
uniref:Uncharacterized protein n=1 Tax=Kalanchoe fedtschenkoi TaxID=63787 RepID=A0A7N0UN87_KALFE